MSDPNREFLNTLNSLGGGSEDDERRRSANREFLSRISQLGPRREPEPAPQRIEWTPPTFQGQEFDPVPDSARVGSAPYAPMPDFSTTHPGARPRQEREPGVGSAIGRHIWDVAREERERVLDDGLRGIVRAPFEYTRAVASGPFSTVAGWAGGLGNMLQEVATTRPDGPLPDLYRHHPGDRPRSGEVADRPAMPGREEVDLGEVSASEAFIRSRAGTLGEAVSGPGREALMAASERVAPSAIEDSTALQYAQMTGALGTELAPYVGAGFGGAAAGRALVGAATGGARAGTAAGRAAGVAGFVGGEAGATALDYAQGRFRDPEETMVGMAHEFLEQPDVRARLRQMGVSDDRIEWARDLAARGMEDPRLRGQIEATLGATVGVPLSGALTGLGYLGRRAPAAAGGARPDGAPAPSSLTPGPTDAPDLSGATFTPTGEPFTPPAPQPQPQVAMTPAEAMAQAQEEGVVGIGQMGRRFREREPTPEPRYPGSDDLDAWEDFRLATMQPEEGTPTTPLRQRTETSPRDLGWDDMDPQRAPRSQFLDGAEMRPEGSGYLGEAGAVEQGLVSGIARAGAGAAIGAGLDEDPVRGGLAGAAAGLVGPRAYRQARQMGRAGAVGPGAGDVPDPARARTQYVQQDAPARQGFELREVSWDDAQAGLTASPFFRPDGTAATAASPGQDARFGFYPADAPRPGADVEAQFHEESVRILQEHAPDVYLDLEVYPSVGRYGDKTEPSEMISPTGEIHEREFLRRVAVKGMMQGQDSQIVMRQPREHDLEMGPGDVSGVTRAAQIRIGDGLTEDMIDQALEALSRYGVSGATVTPDQGFLNVANMRGWMGGMDNQTFERNIRAAMEEAFPDRDGQILTAPIHVEGIDGFPSYLQHIAADGTLVEQAVRALRALEGPLTRYAEAAGGPVSEVQRRLRERIEGLEALAANLQNPPPRGANEGIEVVDAARVAAERARAEKGWRPSLKRRVDTKAADLLPRLKESIEELMESGMVPVEMVRDWYRAGVDAMDIIMQTRIPELKAPANRTLFHAIASVLSNGNEVYAETRRALPVMEQFQRTGRISQLDTTSPEFLEAKGFIEQNLGQLKRGIDGPMAIGEGGDVVLGSHRGMGIEMALARIDALVQPESAGGIGLERAADLLTHGMVEVRGRPPRPFAIEYLGPKVGRYFLDRMGMPGDGQATIDSWMTRLYHYLNGNQPRLNKKGELIDGPTEHERAVMNALMKNLADEMGVPESSAQAVSWYAIKYAYRQAGAKEKSDAYMTLQYAASRAVTDEPNLQAGRMQQGVMHEDNIAETRDLMRDRPDAFSEGWDITKDGRTAMQRLRRYEQSQGLDETPMIRPTTGALAGRAFGAAGLSAAGASLTEDESGALLGAAAFTRGRLPRLKGIHQMDPRRLSDMALGDPVHPNPSIAVTPADAPVQASGAFGDAALVANRRLIGPGRSDVDLFDADAYTPRHPRTFEEMDTDHVLPELYESVGFGLDNPYGVPEMDAVDWFESIASGIPRYEDLHWARALETGNRRIPMDLRSASPDDQVAERILGSPSNRALFMKKMGKDDDEIRELLATGKRYALPSDLLEYTERWVAEQRSRIQRTTKFKATGGEYSHETASWMMRQEPVRLREGKDVADPNFDPLSRAGSTTQARAGVSRRLETPEDVDQIRDTGFTVGEHARSSGLDKRGPDDARLAMNDVRASVGRDFGSPGSDLHEGVMGGEARLTEQVARVAEGKDPEQALRDAFGDPGDVDGSGHGSTLAQRRIAVQIIEELDDVPGFRDPTTGEVHPDWDFYLDMHVSKGSLRGEFFPDADEFMEVLGRAVGAARRGEDVAEATSELVRMPQARFLAAKKLGWSDSEARTAMREGGLEIEAEAMGRTVETADYPELDAVVRDWVERADPGGYSEASIQAMREAADALRSYPVSYLEAKMRRPVSLNEYSGAIVPDDTPPEVIRALQEDHGLQVMTYNNKAASPNAIRARMDEAFELLGRGFERGPEAEGILFARGVGTIAGATAGALSTDDPEAVGGRLLGGAAIGAAGDLALARRASGRLRGRKSDEIPDSPGPRVGSTDETLVVGGEEVAARDLSPEARDLARETVDETMGEGGRRLTGPEASPEAEDMVDSWFNLEKYGMSGEAERVFRQEAARAIEAEPSLRNKRVVTWEEQKAAAESIGLSPGQLSSEGRLEGPEFLAAASMLNRNAEQVSHLLKRRQQAMNPEEVQAIDHQLGLHEEVNNHLLERVAKERSQRGRDLNSLKILANLDLDPILWLSRAQNFKRKVPLTAEEDARIRELVGQARKDPGKKEELIREVGRMKRSTLGEKVGTAWKSLLLTAPRTMGVNISGNLSHAALRSARSPTATGADYLLSKVLKTDRTTVANGAVMRAAAQGAARGMADASKMLGVQQATSALRQGEGVKEALTSWQRAVRDQNFSDILTKYDLQRRVNYDTAALDLAVKGSFLLQGASDRPFRVAAYEAAKSELVQLWPQREGLQPGTAEYRARVRELDADFPEELVPIALESALESVFAHRTKLGSALTAMKSGAENLKGSDNPVASMVGTVGDFVLPFTTVPSGVMTEVGMHTPLGAVRVAEDVFNLRSALREHGSTPEGMRGQVELWKAQKDLVNSMSKVSSGAAALATGFYLFKEGLMTGRRPTTPSERAQWQEEGRMPFSVKIGDKWRSIPKATSPIGGILAAGAVFAELTEDDDLSLGGQLFGAATGIGEMAVETTALGGFDDALRAAQDPHQAQRWAERTVATYFTPTVVASVARAIDPTVRRPENVVQAFMSRVPFASRHVPASLDRFGREVSRGEDLPSRLGNIYDPFYSRQDRTGEDPVLAELGRVEAFFPSRRRQSRSESEQDVRDLVELEGGVIYDQLSAAISSPGYREGFDRLAREAVQQDPRYRGRDWRELADEARKDYLQNLVSNIRRQATQHQNQQRLQGPPDARR